MGPPQPVSLQVKKFFSFSLISPGRWDRSGPVRGGLILGLIYCSLGGVGNWYNWTEGRTSLYVPVLLTAGAIVILIATPRKWNLITISVGGVFILSVIGTLLHRGPIHLGLEIVTVTGILFIICEYVKLRIGKSDETQHPAGKGE